jgi:hypothetical protein
MQSMKKLNAYRSIQIAIVTALFGVLPLSSGVAAAATNDVVAAAQTQALQVWHESVKQAGPPAEGCWSVSYPDHIWKQETCTKVKSYRSIPPSTLNRSITSNLTAKAAASNANQTGDGTDYSALTASLTRSATGSFPTVTGVTSESGAYGANYYTLQLNTNTSDNVSTLGNTSPYCAAHSYKKCATWQQYIYSTDEGSGYPEIFIQNWLFVPTGSKCPSGWGSYNTTSYTGCYTNSNGVQVPNVLVKNLASVKLAGSATASGNDTVTYTYGTKVYAVSQKDSTLQTASTWKQSEFNIVGDGSESPAANFNKGSSLTVNLAVNDGSTKAPTCVGPANGGTTGEYNNLTLGKCTATGGSTPSIQFVESN